MDFEVGVDFLKGCGLNLVGVLERERFPAGFLPILSPQHNWQSLVLVAHAGKSMWQALGEHGFETDDPVDYFSEKMTRQFISDYLDSAPFQWLYPSNLPVPLTALGELVGWSYDSPVGLGIHPEYGLWWAYRAAFVTTLELSPTQMVGMSPCVSCVEKPCVSACPAGALHPTNRINWQTCGQHRVQPQSSCAEQCLARLACPVATEHRYTTEQLNYHYRRSLPTLKAYFQP